MNIAVLIASGLLAAAYLFVGGVGVAGALGLILPWLTGIAPILALAVFIAAARTAEVVR